MKLGILVTKNSLVFAFVGLIQSFQSIIGMVHVEKTDATSISTAIKDVSCLFHSACRGQGYDGCSVMMGHLTGVATQLRQTEPAALQVHCFAHSLNLCLPARCSKVMYYC